MNILEQRRSLQKNIEALTMSQLALVSRYVAVLRSSSPAKQSGHSQEPDDALLSLVHVIQQTDFDAGNITPATKTYRRSMSDLDQQAPQSGVDFAEWDTAWDRLELQLKEEDAAHEADERENLW